MSTLTEVAGGWHPGEVAVHKLLNVPSHGGKPNSRGMPPSYGHRIATSPLVAFGACDEQGRPWTTVLGGERGFSRPIQQGFLGAKTLVDRKHDPVVEALLGPAPAEGELLQREVPLSALSVDLENRDRVKIAGRLVAGLINSQGGAGSGVGEVELAVLVKETLGNCPKYMNKKVIRAHLPSPELVSDALPLPQAALDLIEKADMFFLTTTHGDAMDTNHRGGPPGFVRVARNAPEAEVVLVYPEYSGNRLYESLGNLYLNPKIGVAIPDFDTSDVLYLTGTASILAGADAAALIPHAKLAIRINVTAARFVKDGLPFRGVLGERSPYNPPVRRLATEGALLADGKGGADATATLVKRESLTPTINRYTFRFEAARHRPRMRAWSAGQYVTLDFGPELDEGWSHMRDDEPQSLNDDFVRTFTVSSAPAVVAGGEGGEIKDGTEFEITARTHGAATGLLSRHNLRAMPLEVPIVGFGGEEGFRLSALGKGKMPVFVAGGVGITPLLAQVGDLLDDKGEGEVRLRVVWSLRGEDLPLAVEVVQRNRGLGRVLRLFVTGEVGGREKEAIGKLETLGVTLNQRRLTRQDVLQVDSDSRPSDRKYYLCVSPGLQKVLLVEWLAGEEVVSESFNY
ncbi:Oxidoreductase [Coniochaeta hoffmannii]|uniref:Oxidoreductase n=1 Tax=Coniochaeta hoffmannii TaxID=91930 RepID=A0AA38SIN8_9PEZI|nr:Oxidoreductase [Coniochaeta hoffmannii]